MFFSCVYDRPLPKVQSSCSNMAVGNNQASPVASLPSATPGLGTNSVNSRKPGPLPANLDEMKVCDIVWRRAFCVTYRDTCLQVVFLDMIQMR